MVSPNDYRKTGSVIVRFGSAYLSSCILNTILSIIKDLVDPYDVGSGRRARIAVLSASIRIAAKPEEGCTNGALLASVRNQVGRSIPFGRTKILIELCGRHTIPQVTQQKHRTVWTS